MTPDYTLLAAQVLHQIRGQRERAEAAVAEGDNALLVALLKLNSDRYYELVSWGGLSKAERECLDAAIVEGLSR